MKPSLPHEGTERIRNDTTYQDFTTNCILCCSAAPQSFLVSFLVENPSGKEENFV